MRALLLAVGCCVLCVPALRAADEFTAEKAKALIPAAAGVPSDELQKLGEEADPTKFRPANGESLTWCFLTYAPGPNDPVPTSIKFSGAGGAVNPATVVTALMGPKDKNGKYREYASLIQPEYITDCTCKVTGDTATGTVSFEAGKVYEGKIEYTARKKDGKWRIEEFRLPDIKITTTLGADGKWVKK